ncbi:ABC transporter ATP-binding protein [Sulfitobacter mediterraneus]|jgi:branched-chain amino acid transport system ATP-binding protein|uniref:ABC transporter ATP-binding protein n=1 Tax=Sulfitobacter mediterraneus TaxID=83219 RepID=A0A061SQ94_9RHOB|nr:ABC transporter ATP-binding protein [Sulfitobacter mediterraneus]KAJ01803.1 ABC transporter ATP-binding protein [Sulfitobacter mediterraneus]MBM1312249.1 ABC transporter ATP-binding protein [Sulfitobacter mediterraneus]MBM1316128.1 ABC transporter ATP-binding protein [Sulfitobacter mediterraneus]MBM1324500.1 ABC transporter ATP-binding protein [Sulfitobacter mediterraneus]MBM1328379.1 ABC transporter ATP-binding protein [Sulfitobacter mediterraneus]
MSLLQLEQITAIYGASQALFGVDLTIREGEVVALMGRNGMGKSTTIKVISRLLKNPQGQVLFDGQDIGALPAHKAARLGIGLVPEGRRCFTNLTVRENLFASARPGEWDFARVHALFPRLEERGDQLAGSLSGGEQQMLAIGRALMTNPRLLILDEATEGLAPVVRQEIWAAIATLKKTTSLSILVVDKTISELRQVADSVVILERGVSVWHGTMDALSADVKDRYLGV